MKYYCLFIFIFLSKILFAQNTNKIKVASINGKPIGFYLTHSQIDTFSKLYYNGKIPATFDTLTFAMIDSLLTRNNQTRPFYLYLMNRLMKGSDGILSELISDKCKEYLERYPCEFFNAVHSGEYPISLKEWAFFVGFSVHSQEGLKEFTSKLDTLFKTTHCRNYIISWNNFKTELEKHLQE